MYKEFHRKEKNREAQARYRQNHPDRVLKSWMKTREIKNQKIREKYTKNPEPKREKNREWNKTHQEQIKKSEEKRKLQNPKLFAFKAQKKSQKYRQKHPERVLESDKKRLSKIGITLGMNCFEYLASVKSWSDVIKKRDKNICQICGNKSDISHHIFYRAKIPELSLNPNNGIRLCSKCHHEIHSLNGYK